MNDAETNNLRLYARVLAALESEDEAIAFLLELCYAHELRAIAQRVGIAELLIQGIPHIEIAEMLCDKSTGRKPSSPTISRVNVVLENGEGYLRQIVTRGSEAEGC